MAGKNLDLAFRITADTREGRAAVDAMRKSINDMRQQSGGGVDPFTESVARASGGVDTLATKLRPLQAAFAAVTAAISVREIIGLAESYAQMTARLRLATQYTGDFVEVQAALRQAVNDTRAPLTETVDLYVKLAPAMSRLGKSGQEAVGVIKTITKTVALSGASVQTARGAIEQFGQAIGSGNLGGDELRSIREGVGPLADAIAEGLGVTTDKLKEMGAAGELGPERIIGALQKVAARVDEDFSRLPITVGQAVTLLQNQLLEIVGSADQGSGALQSVARAIVFVAEGIKHFSGAGEALRPFVEFVIDAVDGVSRLFRVVATGLAGYTLAIQQALSGNLDGALATYRSIGDEVQRILDEPLAAQKRVVVAAEDSARARLKIEQDLAKETERLEKLRAVFAGQANADILKDDKTLQKERIEEARKATTEQVKGTERLREALRSAWQTSIDAAREAKKEAAEFFKQASAAAASRKQQAQDRRDKGLTDDERSAKNTRTAEDLISRANAAAIFAENAALSGRGERAKELAEEALELAKQASDYVGKIDDDEGAARLLDRLGEAESAALRAQGKLRQQEGSAQEAVAKAIVGQIDAAEARLAELKVELEKPIELELDITAAEQQIAILEKRLAALGRAQATQGDIRKVDNAASDAAEKTTTVEADTTQAEAALAEVQAAVDAIPAKKQIIVETVKRGTATFSDTASDFNAGQNAPGYAGGGAIRGPGSGTSDSILMWGSNGEFMHRAAAVRYYGLDFMRAINELRLPRFASGGLVSSTVQSALGDGPDRPAMVPSILAVPGIGEFPIQVQPDIEAQMARAFTRAALQRGGRR